MAHAGTPTDLAQQPATSPTNGLWQALLVAAALFALVAGMVLVGTNLAAKGSAIPAADRGYEQIEAQRGATTFAAPRADRRFDELILAPAPLVHYPDVSYEQTRGLSAPVVHYPDVSYEQNRGLSAPTKISGIAPVNRPALVKGHRGAMIDQ